MNQPLKQFFTHVSMRRSRLISVVFLIQFGALLGCNLSPTAKAEPTTQPTTPELEVQGSWYRPHTGTAYLYLRNNTDSPLKLQDLQVDGHAESAEPWPLDPDRKSHWFDFIPATLPPHGVGQVRVNLREQAGEQGVQISVATPTGPRVGATILPQEPALFFSDIGFAKDGSAATFFVSGKDAKIDRVMMDGQDITDHADLRAAESFQNTAVVIVHPATPFARGSYHVFQVHSTDDRSAWYAAHTITNDFILGTYGNTENFSLYQDDALNHYVSFHFLPADQMDKLKSLGLSAGPMPFVGGQFNPKSKQWIPFDVETTRHNFESLKPYSGQIAYYAASDEPDGNDSAAKTLGLHGRITIAMRQLAEQVDPTAATFVQIDNSLKPHNYHVYAETMDYSATHRYNLGQEFLTGDREATAELRQSSQPHPYLWVTQLYPVREKAGERVSYNGRDPLPQEMQLQMYEALANGAKGVLHYIHSGSGGGRGGSGSNTVLWQSMKPIHQQLAIAGPSVVCSTPTTWATASNPTVRTIALLNSSTSLLVIATNQAVVSTKTGFDVPTQKDVTVTVAVPSWMHWTHADEILPGGQLRPIDCQYQNNQAVIALPTLEVGAILWLHGGQEP